MPRQHNVVLAGRIAIGTTRNTEITKVGIDDLSNHVIGCSIYVFRHRVPGLLESAVE
jgi:hypothetical protein